MTGRIAAGTEKIDISPDSGVELAGYPHYPRYNTGIHDPLYATSLYLDNGDVRLLFITLDLLFFSKKYYLQTTKEISLKTGIPEKNIMISCTHTHSGPWASGRLDIESLEKGLQPDPVYIAGLQNKIVSAASGAVSKTFNARIGTGVGRCGKENGVGGNRRDPDGSSDPRVFVLGVRDDNNILKACIVNYTLHPTFLHADNTFVSADYPGYVRSFLEGSCHSSNILFMQGCSGDQSSRYFRRGQSFDEAKRVGTAIGAEALSVIGTIEYSDTAFLDLECMEIGIMLRRFPERSAAESNLKKAENEYKNLKEANAAYIDIQNANVRLLGAEDMLGYILMIEKGAKIDLYEDERPAQINVVGINNGRIITMPGEVFVDFGIQIKNGFKKRNIMIACNSNGCLPGYVYTRGSLKAGGYEIDTSMLSEEMGEKMADTAIDLLELMEARHG